MSQEQFASTIGASVHALRKWEGGQNNPRYASLRRIAEVAHQPMQWFLDGEPDSADQTSDQPGPGSKLKRTFLQLMQGYQHPAGRDGDGSGEDAPPCVRVPIIASVTAHTWEAAITTAVEFETLPAAKLPAGVAADMCFCFRANEGSMTGAGIPRGACVLICRSVEIQSGNVVLLHAGKRLGLKRYVRAREGDLLLSESPAYPPLPVGPDIRIIGKAIRVVIDLA